MGKTLVNNLVEFYEAGEALSARDNVYISSADGLAYKLDVTDPLKRIFSGIAKDTVSLGQMVRVVQSGKIKGFVGLTAGEVVYASTTVPGGFQLAQPASAAETVIIGTAKNANDIIVNASLGVPFSTGGGAGVGGVDILAVQDFETSVVGDFTQDGLVITDVDPLRGLKSAQLTHDGVVTKFFKQVIPVDKKFRGRGLTLKLNIISAATQGNVTITIRNETGAVDIVTNKVLRINSTDSLVNQITFNIPDNCTSLSYEVKALAEAGSPITLVDDVIIETLVNKANDDSLLLNPSFENDIIEFDCTNATAAIVDTTIPYGNNTKMFQMNVSTIGGYCDFVAPTGVTAEGLLFKIGGLFQTSLTGVEYCTLVNGAVDNCIPINSSTKFTQPLATQSIAGATSVGVRVRSTTVTGVVNVDKLHLSMGGLPTGPTISCNGDLDCENVFKATVSSTGVISGENVDWLVSANYVGGGIHTLVFESGIFTVPPTMLVSSQSPGAGRTTVYSITTTGATVRSTNDSGTNIAAGISVSATKAAPDFKPITQQGVVNVGTAQGALLVVTNEGTAINPTINAATITVPFDTVKVANGISWDAINEEATFLQSGKFEVFPFLQTFNNTSISSTEAFLEIDKGSGFVAIPEDNSKCAVYINNTLGRYPTTACPFVIKAKSGDKIRLRITGTTSGDTIINSAGGYPRMTIRSVVDQQTIAASLRFPQTAYIKDVKADGVVAGTCTAGSWLTRDLNTLEGSVEGVSLGTNQFILQSGTYAIEATAPTFGTNNHKAKLRNITDSVDVIIGSSEYSDSAGATSHVTSSRVVGSFVVEGTKTFEIQHRCQTTSSFGAASSFGVNEVYTQVKITRLK